MSGRKAVLERRAQLIERAAAERDALADQLRPWQGTLQIVDRGFAVVQVLSRGLKMVGVGLGVGFAVLAIARPRTIATGLWGGWTAWRTLRAIRKRV